MAVFSRVRNLFSGLLGQWLTRREHKNPGAVYEAAIQARVRQYAKLRESAAGVIYMRGKLSDNLKLKRSELGAVTAELGHAIDCDDDALAVALITRRNYLQSEVDRLHTEVQEIATEAEAAKSNLITFQDQIARLREEKTRMIAKWANARARRHFQRTLDGLAPEADIRALDEVRDHIAQLNGEIEVQRELGDAVLDERLDGLRVKQTEMAARAELEKIKEARRRRLVPMALATGVVAG